MTVAASSRRPRRARSVTESLLSIVLVLEAILVFFVTLTVFGLRTLDPLTAFVGGGFLAVVLLACSAVLRWRAGMAFGWALQVVLILTGLLIPAMWVVGALFAAMWTYCAIRGGRIDREKAAWFAAHPEAAGPEAARPEATPIDPQSKDTP